MRIAQLTLDGYDNYGNILQKYALHHTLKRFAKTADVLWFEDNRFFSETGAEIWSRHVINKERINWAEKLARFEAVRQSKFKDFENLHIKTRFDFPYPEEIVDDYDFFVVGSDQVWNPEWSRPYFFLEFVPREKKIAYAASIGAHSIPDELKDFFRSNISGFDYLSVREEEAAKIINELTGQRPLVLLDPVFLLTEDEWLAVAQKPTWFGEKYQRGFLLTYYLREPPPPEVKTLADKLNLPVINLLDFENYNHFTVGPAEFVWLFAHASFTVTNSFHGTAFSVFFKRPFLNLEIAGDSSGVSMSNRIVTLLKLFGLEDRRQILAKPLKIDFTRRDELLPRERAKAFKFLLEALTSREAQQTQWGGGVVFFILPLICLLVALLRVQIKAGRSSPKLE